MHHRPVLVFLVLVALIARPAISQPVSSGTDSGIELEAPDASESMTFVVLGDRTGGPRAGVEVLRRAVEMSTWLDPDMVMTVGDLIEGYAGPEIWLDDMREFKGIMDELPMRWYPVAGNHDVYARPATPRGHVELYKQHFGPLYYSFTHKFAHFVVLFSDEGTPDGMNFRRPETFQNMSPEQLAWLREDLASANAKRVFVFIHHPRWLDAYEGSNWDEVHQVLVDDGRPMTVVGGHIHNIRDDGQQDNVRYMTLGVVGGHKSSRLSHSSIDHITLVHVRPDRESIVHIPVDTIMPASDFPGWESDEIIALNRGGWLELTGHASVSLEAGATGSLDLSMTNPTSKAIEYMVELDAPNDWSATPERFTGSLEPGEAERIRFDTVAGAISHHRPEVFVRLHARYPLGRGDTQPVSMRLPVEVRAELNAHHGHDHADGFLRLDGRSAVRAELPERPDRFTLEAWVRGSAPSGREGLIANTENSGFGIFWSEERDGASLPIGYAHVQGNYKSAAVTAPWDWSNWTHLALTHDGHMLRMFVNGELVDESEAAGAIGHNRLPLMIGADVGRSGDAVSFFKGDIDEVRLSNSVRYSGSFEPQRKLASDADTLLLFHFDHAHGLVFRDAGPHESHGWGVGSPAVVAED